MTTTRLEHTDKVTPLIEWLAERWSFDGSTVLELGAYNGRNTWQLSVAGAKVQAIEPRIENVEAWGVQCRPFQGLVRAAPVIWHGTLEDSPASGHSDLIFHCGVLYHLADPITHLKRLPPLSPRLYLNTHVAPVDQAGETLHGFPGRYHAEPTRCTRAGLDPQSFWLTRQALFDALHQTGYDSVHVVTDKMERNGPRIGLWCEEHGCPNPITT
jgi:hypothetical protein